MTALNSPIQDHLADQVREAFDANPRQMTPIVARQLGVPEAEVIRRMPNGRTTELDVQQWEAVIRSFEGIGPVHVIASTGAVTLEAFGDFGNFSFWGDYFNVQTKSLDMHIRFKELGAIFAVEKPSHLDGVETLSVQFFDQQGSSAFKVFITFGMKPPTDEAAGAFAHLRDSFALEV